MSRDAVKLAQTLIDSFGQSLTADGSWGPKSERAWKALSEENRSYINSRVLALEGVSVDQLRNIRSVERPSPARNVVSASYTAASRPPVKVGAAETPAKDRPHVKVGAPAYSSPPVKVGYSRVMLVSQAEANNYGNEVDRIFSLPRGTCAFILDLEAHKDGNAYDAAFKGGSGNAYWGLGQFDNRGESWNVAANTARRYGVLLRTFSDAWYDWKQSVLAIGAYAAHHKSQLTAWNLPVTKEALYACHQQGSGWYRNAKRGTQLAGAQSRVSVAVINTALAQRYA